MNYEPQNPQEPQDAQAPQEPQQSAPMSEENRYFDRTAEPRAYYSAPPSGNPDMGNGLAIASLILGLVGFVCCSGCFPPVSILAVVFALIDRHKRGHFLGTAVGGLVLGAIGLFSFFASFFAFITFFGLAGAMPDAEMLVTLGLLR